MSSTAVAHPFFPFSRWHSHPFYVANIVHFVARQAAERCAQQLQEEERQEKEAAAQKRARRRAGKKARRAAKDVQAAAAGAILLMSRLSETLSTLSQ